MISGDELSVGTVLANADFLFQNEKGPRLHWIHPTLLISGGVALQMEALHQQGIWFVSGRIDDYAGCFQRDLSK